MWLRLHVFYRYFVNLWLNMAYLTRMSEWRLKYPAKGINDFYSGSWRYHSRFDLYKDVISRENLDAPIDYLEFGVAQGHSFKWWLEQVKHPEARFHGFDTFTGLPENWNFLKAGTMSAGGNVPQTDDTRATFHKGLFQDTLPGFIAGIDKNRRKVLLMDADLYTSTLYVLTSLAPYLKAGDIILFDEFSVPQHEFRAWMDFTSAFRVDYELLGAQNNYYFTAFRLV